ncbi:MAG: hypothetical protein HC876_07835 [Chloroflexaceae bacterium]|nr:hypothetical protein [Chloroflexaceae bacterium]NJO05422.1 hypothetical protein [Chloroflexaceae bacterium]
MHWRCNLTFADNINSEADARQATLHNFEAAVHWSTSEQESYFSLPNSANLPCSALAARLVQAFPEVCARGYGSDPAYVEWYREMLRLTAPDTVPVAYADYPINGRHGAWVTAGDKHDWQRDIPVPPAPRGRG